MISVSVLGADRVARGLSTLAARLRDLSPSWRLVGARMVRVIQDRTPVFTGRLVASIKARASRTDLVVAAGGGSLEYAGVQNFGWAARNIRARRFMDAGEQLARQQAADEIESLLTRTARAAGL